MKILYSNSKNNSENSSLIRSGFKDCFLKKILFEKDYKRTTYKFHYHIEYEIHIVISGKQSYEINGEVLEIQENEFLIIPPNTNHGIQFSSENLLKFTLTFSSDNKFLNKPYKGEVTRNVTDGLLFISDECSKKLNYSPILIENRILEILITLFRIADYKEGIQTNKEYYDDILVELAKKFIKENITQNLTTADVAAYCHISTRQLARRFQSTEECLPFQYINNEKMSSISLYVKDSELSLQQISDFFSFSSYAYFNSSFKKHFGMSPLTYRKMFRNY